MIHILKTGLDILYLLIYYQQNHLCLNVTYLTPALLDLKH